MNGNILDSSGNPIKDRKLFETIVNWLCKYWKIWLPIVISMFALITSIASYGLSRKAILLSTDQFFMENKPYIILQPEKFNKIQSYYKYTLIPDEFSIKMELLYKVKNIGNAGAKDLTLFNKLQTGNISGEPKISDLVIPNKITIGPSQSVFITINFVHKCSSKEKYNIIESELSSAEGTKLTFQVGVSYINELNLEQRFCSISASNISKKEAQIIKMEYEEE